jgi:hypothetical protein
MSETKSEVVSTEEKIESKEKPKKKPARSKRHVKKKAKSVGSKKKLQRRKIKKGAPKIKEPKRETKRTARKDRRPMRAITMDSLTLLIAIETLGPDVGTVDIAAFCQKMGLKLPTEPGSRQPLLQGQLRQMLRIHVKHGRIKFRKASGQAHAGQIYLWSVTPEGKEVISEELKILRRITALAQHSA